MMHVKYILDRSGKHGIGLFAGEEIRKGQVVYTASPVLDVNITQQQYEDLSESERQEVKYWGFWDEPSQRWHVDFDVSRFINHDVNATLSQDSNKNDAHLVATRDISENEELTQNYLEFETEEDLKKRGIK